MANPFDQFDGGNPFDQFNAPTDVTPIGAGGRLMQGVRDPADAGAQLLAHSLPSGVVNAVNSATNYVNNLPVIGPITKALGMTPATPQQLDQKIATNEANYQARRAAAGSTGMDLWRSGGNVLGTLPLAPLLPEAAASIPGSIGTGALTGGTLGLFNPVTNGGGDYWGEKGKQVATGAITGAAFSPMLTWFGRMVNPKVNPDVKTLIDNGVTPTPGQILGGGWKRTEDAATSVPVLGDMIKNAQRRSMDDFNVAALNRSGVNVTEGGQEGIAQARKFFNSEYDRVLGQMSHQPDQAFEQAVMDSGIQNRVSSDGMKELAGMLKTDYVPKFENVNGVATMTGDEIKAFDRQLRLNANSFSRSQDPMQQRIGQAYNDIRQSFRDSLARQNNQGIVGELNQLDKNYASFAQYRNAATMANALKKGGMITPDQYMNAVAKGAKQTGSITGLSEGNALNQDLAGAAGRVLGSSVPDSGTPFRHAIQAGIGAVAGHTMLPESVSSLMVPAAASVGAASLPYTTLGQKLMAAALTKRPTAIAPQLESVLRNSVPSANAGLLSLILQPGS